MTGRILSEWNFRRQKGGWVLPALDPDHVQATCQGLHCSAGKDGEVHVDGPGVHTRNNDSVELLFSPEKRRDGRIVFWLASFSEYVRAELDLKAGNITLTSSDYTRPQVLARGKFVLPRQSSHLLILEKNEGSGDLVKNADVNVYLNGKKLLSAQDINVAPEMGVKVQVTSGRFLLRRFIHRGIPSGIPEYFHVGAWQAMNTPSVETNLQSLFRGLRLAAECGVQLLVTPETSITGLFPLHRVTRNIAAVTAAERKLQRFMKRLKNAPHLVAGLPVWKTVAGHRKKKTRYNASRLYDPDGHIMASFPKIFSCEDGFWNGYRLHEFNICGVPTCMYICHDGRYPDVWTLPVMFGSRLILHPSNGGRIRSSIEAFETTLSHATLTSHAFYVLVNGGGGSGIAGPGKGNNIIAVVSDGGSAAGVSSGRSYSDTRRLWLLARAKLSCFRTGRQSVYRTLPCLWRRSPIFSQFERVEQ